METHKKQAFLKFFLIYFLSVAILILTAGVFYYNQMKNQFLQSEEFSMISYARDIKMGNNLSKYRGTFSHTPPKRLDKFINIDNFTILKDKFMKYIPKNRYGDYIQIFKSKKSFDKKINKLKLQIAITQLILLLLFGIISYKLAKSALKPLEESINKLDKFAKDLIHDLNTPIASIKLNMQILDKDERLKENSAIKRIKKSTAAISELYENLTILLEEETFQLQNVDIVKIARENIAIQKQLYPNINFVVDNEPLFFKTNPKAIKQILQNLISNACKYNKKDGYVKIYAKDKKLYIEDSGVGIKHPDKIFGRSFSERNSSGIGLDIVNRLAKSLHLKIEVSSTEKGSTFILMMS